MKHSRLPASTFDFPYEAIARGEYSDQYFNATRQILSAENRHKQVLMQVFARAPGMVCGLDAAIAILRKCSDRGEDLTIHALRDGEHIDQDETVMTIEGDYLAFAHLETVHLGILARATSIATATREVVEAAGHKPVLFFPARFDFFLNQSLDGYAAHIAGAASVSTHAQGKWYGDQGTGTIPHGLIAAYEGNTLQATLAFDRIMPTHIKRIALVDFDNDCIGTSLQLARAMGDRLYAVRFDTGATMVDKSMTSEKIPGVSAELVTKARKAFDEAGFGHLKIVVTGGFTAQRIYDFVARDIPFDIVGVGSSLLAHTRIDFTADIVQVDGVPCAKAGRRRRPNPRLKLVS